MKKTAFLAVAAATLALQASAQSALNQGHLDAIDADGDGAVTRAEFDTFAATAFDMMDQDSNSSLSSAELEPHVAPERVAATDTNGDGTVSRQEFGQRMNADFAAADRDGNDIID